MLVREVMSHPVVTVRAWTTITETAQILAGQDFTCLPVLDDDDALVGIVSEADLLRKALTPDPRRHPHLLTEHESRPGVVADVMTTMVESLTPGADVADAARIMVDERIRALPIVGGAKVVGMVTRRDLLRSSLIRDDESLRHDAVRALEAFGDPDRWTVTVQAAVADVEDFRDSSDDRQVAHRLVSAVPGIVHVDVHHETSDPF
jgi:CBS-domain-containing membrane protein